MASQLVWSGLKEYLAELKALPEECQKEAANEIEGGVNAAYVTIKRVYEAHRFTGTLSKRLTISPMKGGLVLRSASPIAWLFDNGSKVRHWGGGTGKSTGKMWGQTSNPPTHIFSSTVAKERRKLTQRFKDMLTRRGAASVTGE